MRCFWCNIDNPLYVKYHDEEWGVLNLDEHYLFEMLILESFQAGLSWECVLNKREDFRLSYDEFELDKVILYDEEKIKELMNNPKIIRNKLKIKASVKNALVFKNIQEEYGSFKAYLLSFFLSYPLIEVGNVTSKESDAISSDLKKRGMTFVGSVIIYSYLQAIGLVYSHEKNCSLYKELKGKRSKI